MDITAGSGLFAASRVAGHAPILRETRWGYVLRGVALSEEAPGAVAALRFLGLVMVLCAHGQWLLPGFLFGGDALVAKAGLSLVLGLAGGGLYWFAGRRLRTDVHVDLRLRELRFVEVNGRGQAGLRRMVPMAAVQAAYVARTPGSGGAARLLLSLNNRAFPVEVAQGGEDEILAAHRRLAGDLRPAGARVAMKLARTVPFRSSRAGAPSGD